MSVKPADTVRYDHCVFNLSHYLNTLVHSYVRIYVYITQNGFVSMYICIFSIKTVSDICLWIYENTEIIQKKIGGK